MSWSLIQGVLWIDQDTEKEARAHKVCRAIQEEEEEQSTEYDTTGERLSLSIPEFTRVDW
jgi:hypothetical protein